MSMMLCAVCGAFCDSDDYPEGFYRYVNEELADEPSDEYRCETCNQESNHA